MGQKYVFCLIEEAKYYEVRYPLRPDGDQRISAEFFDYTLEIIVHLGLFADDFSPQAGIVFG